MMAHSGASCDVAQRRGGDATRRGASSTARALADPKGEFRFRDGQRMQYLAKRLQYSTVTSTQRWPPELILRTLKERLGQKYADTRRAFRAMDKDGSGTLSRQELRFTLHSFNVAPPEEDFAALWLDLDRDSSGFVSLERLKAKIGQLHGGDGPERAASESTETSLRMPDNFAILRETMKPPQLGRFTPAQVRAQIKHRLTTAKFARAADFFARYDVERTGRLPKAEFRRCLREKLSIELRDDDFETFVGESGDPVDYVAFLSSLGTISTGSYDYTRCVDEYRRHVDRCVFKASAEDGPTMQTCGHMGAFVGTLPSSVAERRKLKTPQTLLVDAKEATRILVAKFASAPTRIARWFRHADRDDSSRVSRRDLEAMFVDLGVFLGPADFATVHATLNPRPDGSVCFADFVRVLGADVANMIACDGVDWGTSIVSNQTALDMGLPQVQDKFLPCSVDHDVDGPHPYNPAEEDLAVVDEEPVLDPPTEPVAEPAVIAALPAENTVADPPEHIKEPAPLEEEELPQVARRPAEEPSRSPVAPPTRLALRRPRSGPGHRVRTRSLVRPKTAMERAKTAVERPKTAVERPKTAVERPRSALRQPQVTQLNMGDNLRRQASPMKAPHAVKISSPPKASHMLKIKERQLLHNGLPQRNIPPPRNVDPRTATPEAVWWGGIGRELWQPKWHP